MDEHRVDCSRTRADPKSGPSGPKNQRAIANMKPCMSGPATSLKLLLATLLVSLVEQQHEIVHAKSATHHQRALNLTHPHRKRDSPLSLDQNHLDAPLHEPLAAQLPPFTIPPNQRQIIEMLPQEEQKQQTGNANSSRRVDCSDGLLTFEIATGFIYKPASSVDTLSMMPSTLQLTDCLNYCLQNSSCVAINFEMGLCVLLTTSATENPQNLYSSQFPVFTIYAEKKCLLSGSAASKRRRKCQRAWTFERVSGFEMKLRARKRLKLATKELCMDACLSESDFECRSANWYRQTGECHLNDQDRHSVSQSEASDQQIKASLSDFYGPAAGSLSANQTQARPAASGGLYQNYRHSTGSQNKSATTEAAATTRPNEGALSSKLTSSWTGGKKHSKKVVSSQGADEKQHKSGGNVGQARLLAADWSTAGAGSSFDGHYIDVPAITHVDYLENNCIYEPNKLCEFRKIQNRILKTVDSIYQDVATLEECKQKCLNAPYRCYSFDYGDTSERICRTSHLDQASLLSVNEPYLEVVGAITYELATCFNVSIQCRAREMLVQVSSSKSFNGKIYAKSRPASCVTDVLNALHFELAMKYHDDELEVARGAGCNVRASSDQLQGVFSNDIVIQHHDRIMTTQDVGLSVFCQHDLANRSVSNNIDLSIEPLDEGPISSKNSNGSHAASKSPITITGLATTVVRSPNVTMRITNMNGQPVTRATVGDRLALMFEVKEKTSPFGIFVREIVAMDGRQFMEHQEQLRHHPHLQHGSHKANSSSAAGQSTQAATRPEQFEGESDRSTSASVLYYSSTSTPGPQAEALTSVSGDTFSANSISPKQLNETLIESIYRTDTVNSIQFIDSDGCPTDANLMGPIVKMDPHGHRLLAPFDAFKFPTSDVVFFRAVVTSCLAECKPAVCPNYHPSSTAATLGALYSNSLSQTDSNSITADETPPLLKNEPTAGVAQLLTSGADN